MSKTRFDPPKYIGRGSEGVAVNTVLILLLHWAKQKGLKQTGVVLNEEFGEAAEELLKKLQKATGLAPSGRFGPDERRVVRQEIGFDLVELLQNGDCDVTMFCQPDGTLFWAPGIAATHDEAKALRDFDAVLARQLVPPTTQEETTAAAA